MMRVIDARVSQAGAVLLTALIAALSWRYALIPTIRTYRGERARLLDLSQRVTKLEKTIQDAGGKTAWLAKNQERLSALKAKFPQQDQLPQVLNALNDALKSGDMKLLDVKQGNLESAKDMEKPLLIDGKACLRLPVSVVGEGRYHAVVAVLDRLQSQTFPGVVSVDQIELKLKEATSAMLDAKVQLSIYLVGTMPNPAPDA